MVGRGRERALLSADLDEAARGFGRGAVLVGEAGIGKSTLADWLVGEAGGRGFRVARTGCSAAGLPPVWVWRQGLRGIAPDLPWQADAPTDADRSLLVAAVVEAVSAAARTQPLLVVLEDVHWADPDSLVVTRAVADALPATPVMLVLTCRAEDVASQVRDQLTALPTRMRRMDLPPLDVAEVGQLAANVVGTQLDDAAARELHARTGGNPFFAHEVARLMAAQGSGAALVVPQGVRDVLERRLARLSQPSAALLARAAVAAESASELIEVELLEQGQADVAAGLGEAAAARLVEAAPGAASTYRFRHALIREVLAQTLSDEQRAALHAHVAARLEQRPDVRELSARLAHHWLRASGARARSRATYWTLRAARDAMARFGFEAAAGHFRQALTDETVDRVAVSIELGEALQLSGDVAAAREVLLAAAEQAASTGRAVPLAEAALAVGGGLAGFEVPIMDDAQAELLRRADAALPEREVAWRAAVRGRLSLALAGTAPVAERVTLAEDAVRLARRGGDRRIESAVLAAYCDAIAGPDFVDARIAAAGRMLELADSAANTSLRDQAGVLLARRLLLLARLESGDFAAADEQAAAYERVSGRIGLPRYAWLPELWRGMRALLAGDADAALLHAASAEDIGRRAGSVNAELLVFSLRLHAHLERGTTVEYADEVERIVQRLAPLGLPATYFAAPARALLQVGRRRYADQVLQALLAGNPESLPKDAEWLEAYWAMADLAIGLDNRRAASVLYDALLPYARLWAVDGIGGAVFGTVAEQLGRLARHLGRPDEAAIHLRDACERYEAAGTVVLRERASAELGRLGGARERDEAVRPVAARLGRDGRVWRFDWNGRRTTVPDAKGVRDLAVLLTRPGRAVPAVDLLEAAGGPQAGTSGGDLGAVLDDTARRAYRARLAELDRDIAEAEADADLGRLDRLRAERSMIADELAGALGLGGRARRSGDPVERARKAVTMRIRSAIAGIEAQDEALARHLRNAVHTGRVCSYEPEPPVTWQLTMSGEI
jgi:hypothetical protein